METGETKVVTLFAPLRHIVRLTVEAVTPLSIASGDTSADIDSLLFRDWNGLPCLSGPTIAGVLRALYQDYFEADAAARLFGYEAQRQSDDGEASRILVSFGYVHRENDTAVDGWIGAAEISRDALLSLLAGESPVLRDHVAIGSRGTAREHLKFDRSSCPIGTRFSFELCLDGQEADAETDRIEIENAASLILSPYARFGGAGRRGLGRLGIVRAHYACIDRRGERGRRSWLAYRKSSIDLLLPNSVPIALVPPPDQQSCRLPIVGELRLGAKFFWRMGQGPEPWGAPNADSVPDVVPLSEPIIVWDKVGTIVTRPIAPVPGAGVKGAIAHRAEFHLRRLRGRFVETGATVDDEPRLSDQFFGAMHGDDNGFAGSVLIDDCKIDYRTLPNIKSDMRTGARTRTSLDRHAGGVRLQKLFSDEALWKGEMILTVTVLSRVPANDNRLVGLSNEAAQAIAWAFDDLCSGDLALGAREGAGDGVFEGNVIWRVDNEPAADLVAAVEMINTKTQARARSLERAR
jgi:CRISPR/Cas system CSM-associated protein Csm3 (group 7 of RAMP superfamily)